jgi:hypothetical protein
MNYVEYSVSALALQHEQQQTLARGSRLAVERTCPRPERRTKIDCISKKIRARDVQN